MNTLVETDPKPIPVPLMPEDRRVRQGAWILLASLGIFFFASMLLYVIYVYLLQGAGIKRVPLRLPFSFVGSTCLLLGISLSLHLSTIAAKRDLRLRLIQLLTVALAMSIGFFLLQFEGMGWMIREVWRLRLTGSNVYAFTLVLAFVHALHVVGGLVALVWVCVNAVRGKYDHERNYGVQFCTLYWHFLDIVWLVMLLSFLVASWLIGA